MDQNAVTVSGRSFRVLENIRGHRNEIQDQIKTAKKDCSCGKDIMKVKKNDISASAGTSKAKESSGPSTSKGTDNEGAVSNCFVKLERIDDSLIKKKVGRKPGPKIGCSGGPILFVDLETGDDVSESPANPTATECRRKVITDKSKSGIFFLLLKIKYLFVILCFCFCDQEKPKSKSDVKLRSCYTKS